MSEDSKIKAEFFYATLENDITEKEKVNEDIKKEPEIFTLPLGYGKVALRVGTVSSVKKEEDSIKPGDLVLIYGNLKEQLKSGETLTEDQKEYSNKHPVAQLVITKDYARQLAKILLGYATAPTEEEFFKRLKED